MPKHIGLDDHDLQLLELVQANNRLTSEELASTIGLSATACQRRLKRLREEGVIRADVAILDPASVGRSILLVVEVTVERERPDILDRFKEAMRQTPEVMQCYYVTGDTDFVLLVSARDMADYEAFTRRFIEQNSDIKRFRTNVVMDPVKIGMSLPLDPSE